MTDFMSAPDNEILFSATSTDLGLFGVEKCSRYLIPKAGVVVGSNDVYMRFWHEVSFYRIIRNAQTGSDIPVGLWFPLHKGGGYRKYYGIHEYVLNLGQMLCDKTVNKAIRIGDREYYFKKGITWSTLSNKFAIRESPKGFIYNTKGSMCFAKDEADLALAIYLKEVSTCP